MFLVEIDHRHFREVRSMINSTTVWTETYWTQML